jgi:peptidyl-prolyl cis-trans isomerase SurA
MNRYSALLWVQLLVFVFVAAGSPVQGQDRPVMDEIVAVVDGDILLRSDVNGLVFNAVQQGSVQYSTELWFDALNQLIDQKVLAAHAKRDTNFTVTDEQIDQVLDQRITSMSAQVGGRERLEEVYGKTVIQIRAELRGEFRDQLLADQFQRTHLQRIRTTPTEVKAWFSKIPTDSLPTLPEAVQVSHIVRYPKVTEKAREDARQILEIIRDSIVVGGATFEEMATLFSDDPGSSSKGGLYQGSKLSEFVPEFGSVASRIAPDTVSQIFETEFGLHILRVNARRGDVVDLNQILIQFDARKFDPADALKFLTILKDSIETHNLSFARIAKENSEDKLSANRGGRVLDPRTYEKNLYIEALGPKWQSAVSLLDPGQIGDPTEVELLDGRRAYHIVKLHARTPAHRVSIETDYDMVKELALRDKQALEMRAWLDELRKSVYVRFRVPIPDDIPIATSS